MTSHKAFLYFIWSLVGSVFLLCITFFLSFNIFRYAGDLQVVSQFYTEGIMDSFRQLDVVPFKSENNKATLTQLDELLIRYYIEKRYMSIPDQWEMGRNWYPGSFFYGLTTTKIYTDFIPDIQKKLSSLSSSVKTVDILDIQQNGVKKDRRGNDIYTYTIDVDIYTRTLNGEVGRSQKKRVVLQIGHYPRRIFWNKRFNTPYGSVVGTNPYGFFIGDFSETDRK